MPRVHSSAVALALAAVVAGCSSTERGGQVLVFIDTDAPLPADVDANAAPALFDRLRLEVYPPGATEPCSGCTRIVSLDGPSLDHGLSFGVGEPTAKFGTRVRGIAYRSSSFPEGNPTKHASLEVTIALPAVSEAESSEVTLYLPTDETGQPTTSPDTPGEPIDGAPTRSHAGSWPRARRIECAGSATPDQVCVPGGAFWMPSPGMDALTVASGARDEQLVVVSPFFIDRTEVTVGALLRSGFVKSDTRLIGWSGDQEGVEIPTEAHDDWCTYSGSKSRQVLPVNCIQQAAARAYCHARGGELPTEAQFTYAAGATASAPYPWGLGEPTCSDATWGHTSQLDLDFNEGGVGFAGQCTTPGEGFIPYAPVGTSARDRVALSGGTVEDLAANGQEMMLDRYTVGEGPCLTEGIAIDPVCDPDSVPGDETVLRGGSLLSPDPIAISTRWRDALASISESLDTTFRCVLPGDAMNAAPEPPKREWVATGCDTDADCGDGDGICVGEETGTTDAVFGGGAAGGYCTAACNTDAECGPANTCELHHCLRSCSLSTPAYAPPAMLQPSKCHGRRDLACASVGNSAVCVPMCGSDSQCPGRFCDPKNGVCSDQPALGLPDGSFCTSSADCRGNCIPVTSQSICLSYCSLGGELDSEDCGGVGQCLANVAGAPGAGSVAFCLPPCTTHSDCPTPVLWCSHYTDPSVMFPSHWNIAGAICRDESPCASPGAPCGGAEVCSATPDGNFCLDPTIAF